jgi:hypothetical protein
MLEAELRSSMSVRAGGRWAALAGHGWRRPSLHWTEFGELAVDQATSLIFQWINIRLGGAR